MKTPMPTEQSDKLPEELKQQFYLAADIVQKPGFHNVWAGLQKCKNPLAKFNLQNVAVLNQSLFSAGLKFGQEQVESLVSTKTFKQDCESYNKAVKQVLRSLEDSSFRTIFSIANTDLNKNEGTIDSLRRYSKKLGDFSSIKKTRRLGIPPKHLERDFVIKIYSLLKDHGLKIPKTKNTTEIDLVINLVFLLTGKNMKPSAVFAAIPSIKNKSKIKKI